VREGAVKYSEGKDPLEHYLALFLNINNYGICDSADHHYSSLYNICYSREVYQNNIFIYSLCDSLNICKYFIKLSMDDK
jgi:hypothetical protein